MANADDWKLSDEVRAVLQLAREDGPSAIARTRAGAVILRTLGFGPNVESTRRARRYADEN
jgi:hypothetical protein